MPEHDSSFQRPREQLPIPIFGHAVLAVRNADGVIYLNIHDACDAMDVAFSAQRRRILADERLRAGFAQFRVSTSRGPSDQDFLQLELVPVWLLSIQLRRVSETVRAKLGYGRTIDAITVTNARARQNFSTFVEQWIQRP